MSVTGAAFDRLLALVQAKGERGDAAALAEVQAAISALENARQAAEAANEAKTRFLASVSHEIRSPLNAIYGYAQLLERNDGQDAVRAAKVIRRSSEHLSHLIEGLLDIAQVESCALKLSRDAIRLRTFLEQLIDMLELQAQAKGIALALDCPATLPEFVRADQKRLRQVLINIISNAIKFTDVGQVTLKVHYRNELATFTVLDTGIGIAAKDAERIFTPFERVGEAAEGRPGIGLGLAITQALVRIMGGDIQLESTPGKGSCFTVRLMLSQPLAPPIEVAGPAAVTGYIGRPRSLLLIDDDPAHLAMVSGLLAPLGFAIQTAAEGTAALALAARTQPDLVLCDVSLPGLSGWDIAAELRQRHGPGLRVVMLSGEAETDTNAAGRPPVNDVFVMKPFDFDRLIDVIGEQLGLEWLHAAASAPLPDTRPEVLPGVLREPARAHFAAIERLVRIGHVRAIEAEIDAIAALGPDAGAVAERLRDMLDAFDLRALSQFSRVAQAEERAVT
jgi:nitrogen-specific signal transduction histidine kinase/DNA-binding NarL/FixJ family response regulator